jgi:hypothetical protein
MPRMITWENAAIIVLGLLITIGGVYMNFQNLQDAQMRFRDADVLVNNEIISGLLMVVGMAFMFAGGGRAFLKRAEAMDDKFLNLTEAFTALIRKQVEILDEEKSAPEAIKKAHSHAREDLLQLEKKTQMLKRRL